MTGQYWDNTWNVVIGCDRVSKGCDGCFAIPTGAIRQANPHPAVAAAFAGTVRRRAGRLDWTGRVNMLDVRLDQPLRWRKPRRIYVTLLGDLFHDGVTAEFIAKVFAVISLARQHTFLLVTKRHARMRSLLSSPEFRIQVQDAIYALARDETTTMDRNTRRHILASEGADGWPWTWPLANLHLGVSVEDQQTANLRIPALLATPAAVRWVSVEPLLAPVDLTRIAAGSRQQPDMVYDVLGGRYGVPGAWQAPMSARLDWFVVGGESENPGHKARPMHPDWVRSLRDQAVAAGVPWWFKQHGEYLPVPVVDKPDMLYGRAYHLGGWHSLAVHERGTSGTFRNGRWRPLEVGERVVRAGILLDRDTFAARVKEAGRELDGRTWDMLPGDQYPADVPEKELADA